MAKLSDIIKPKESKGKWDYGRRLEYMTDRARNESMAGRDIGDIPAVVNPDRRRACGESLRLFIETYFRSGEKFALPWSPQHLEVMADIEDKVKNGGLMALAMPRGSGKTSILERAILWAALYGYRHFIVAIGDGESAAAEILDCVKMEIETNQRLQEDFPEVCHPVKSLGRVMQRCQGQHIHGKHTRMQWGGSTEVVFPTVDGSPSSGCQISCCGITGRIRGMKRTTADGRELRPDFVFLDDPQNDESAGSPEQNQKRLAILRGTVLGLAGPGKKIAGVMCCTVIRPEDMADQILDAKRNPSWHGRRYALMDRMPADMEAWQLYAETWAEGHRAGKGEAPATEYYLAHREELDRGAECAWKERYNPDQASAIQHAMDLYFSDKASFFSEYQNAPLGLQLEDAEGLTTVQVYEKCSGVKRRTVPIECERLEAFIDVQGKLLYYAVMAFASDWTAHVIDYGSWPDQHRAYFTLNDAAKSYQDGDGSFDHALQKALEGLCGNILTNYVREDGTEMQIERCLIDSGWGKSTLGIYQFCARGEWKGIVMASKGVGITADRKPFNEYQRGRGDTVGDFWIIQSNRKKRTARVVQYDTNFAKSLWRSRLLTPSGVAGSFMVFGDRRTAAYDHRMLAEQLTAEYSTPTAGKSRRVDVWKCLPGRDNHFLDCVVGCYVAASERGLRLDELGYRMEPKPAKAWSPEWVESEEPKPAPPEPVKPGRKKGTPKRVSIPENLLV